ncbi:hypothetical protein [Salmonella phage SD-13_S19]|nr:hypothetical protein [Salmonella phage SD-13_S19]WPK20458.1 hypothetical protein [Salmonella phage SD-14_S20]
MYVRAYRWARFLCSIRIFIDKNLLTPARGVVNILSTQTN